MVDQAVEDLDQLLRLAEREAELAGPLSGDADLRAPRTLVVDQRSGERHLKRELATPVIGQIGQGVELLQALAQMADDLGESRAAGAPLHSLEVVVDRPVSGAALREMPSQKVRLGQQVTRRILLQDLGRRRWSERRRRAAATRRQRPARERA